MRRTLALAALVILLTGAGPVPAATRTFEFQFALSADSGSQFSSKFAALSAGRVVIEASWVSSNARSEQVSLSLILFRPDGSVAVKKTGFSDLRADYVVSEAEAQSLIRNRSFKWTARLVNDADQNRHEVGGRLRVTVPSVDITIEDAQFTLLGLGNAQEITFMPPASGRIAAEVDWRDENRVPQSTAPPALTVSLIHPADSRTHARRQGASPIRVEHHVTEQEIDKGARWVVRIQNDSDVRVRGRIKVTYSPSL
jgi:hypothetical protein